MIPGLNDAELERILAAAKQHGAGRAGYVLLKLPLEIRQMFEEWVRHHYPDRAQRVLALIRETRGGRMNDSNFGSRQTGTGAYADLLANRFRLAMQRLGLNQARVPGQRLDCSQFRVPEDTSQPKQLALL